MNLLLMLGILPKHNFTIDIVIASILQSEMVTRKPIETSIVIYYLFTAEEFRDFARTRFTVSPRYRIFKLSGSVCLSGRTSNLVVYFFQSSTSADGRPRVRPVFSP